MIPRVAVSDVSNFFVFLQLMKRTIMRKTAETFSNLTSERRSFAIFKKLNERKLDPVS